MPQRMTGLRPKVSAIFAKNRRRHRRSQHGGVERHQRQREHDRHQYRSALGPETHPDGGRRVHREPGGTVVLVRMRRQYRRAVGGQGEPHTVYQ